MAALPRSFSFKKCSEPIVLKFSQYRDQRLPNWVLPEPPHSIHLNQIVGSESKMRGPRLYSEMSFRIYFLSKLDKLPH